MTVPSTATATASQLVNIGHHLFGDALPDRLGADAVPPEYPDDALALAFSQQRANELRYTAPWNRWSIWDGQVWKTDNTRRVLDLIRDVSLVRFAGVKKLTALPRSSLYDLMKRGEFPRPVRLSERSVAWILSEVENWIQEKVTASRGSAESTDEVRV